MKRMAIAATLVVVAIALISLVLLQRGQEAMRSSDAALSRGDAVAAIVFAERAAQSRLPLSPYPEAGYRRLIEIADRRVADNDDATARAALGAVLRAARTTGDARNPHADDARAGLAKIDARAKRGPASATAGGDLAPTPIVRFALASSVILVAAALASLGRGARYGWPLLGVGIVTLVFAALQ